MVRHHPRRPKTNAGAQRAALQPSPVTGGPAAQQSSPPQAEVWSAAGHGQLGFPDRVYLLAAAVFQNNHRQKPASHRLVHYGAPGGSPLPEVTERETERAAYELAFNTLKYQQLLEDILIDSCFHLARPMPEEKMSLVAVMLYDFQDRKFLPREPGGEEPIQEVQDVEDCLHRFKTKLAASLARCQIKHDLLTIDHILPESLRRNQERASTLPLYAWVNPLRSSVEEVQEALSAAGFTQAPSVEALAGRSFCPDPRCADVLAFPAGLRPELHAAALLSDHKLLIQERTCSLGPHAARLLLSGEGDLLLAGSFSGLSAAHAAALVAGDDRGGAGAGCRVLVCVGGRTARQQEELQGVLTATGCKNVGLIPQDFQALRGDDPRLQGVRVVLLMLRCSMSALSTPLDFILTEDGDRSLLPSLSQGRVAQSRLDALVTCQTQTLHHALNFPKVRAVVYCTFSVLREENEEVVWRCLEQDRAQQEVQPKLQNFGPSPALPGFLLSAPGAGGGGGGGGGGDEPFLRLEPTAHSNGCFLALLSREPEPVEEEETPQEVLSRANAKGLLDRIGVHQPAARRARKGVAAARTTREPAAPRATPPLPRGPGTAPPRPPGQPRSSETKTSSAAAAGPDPQGWTNRRPGLAKAPCWPPRTVLSNAAAPASEGGDCLRQSAEAVCPYMGAGHVLTSALNGATFNPFLTSMAPPTHPVLAAAAAPARPRPCLVMKPLALTLPPVPLPSVQLANHSRAGVGWAGSIPTFSWHRWRPPPAQTGVRPTRSWSNLNKDLQVQPRPWL